MSHGAANQLITSISLDRFSRYLQVADGDRELALALYRWNVACSASFYGPLQSLEIALRNGIHKALTLRFGQQDWWDHPNLVLADIHRAAVADARTNVLRDRKPETPSRVVAELTFGFWVGLLGRGRNYEMTLWRPTLRHVFRGYSGPRIQLHSDLDRRRTFRNRIAHHEPVFHRHLAADFHHITRLIGLISPAMADWVRANSRVPDVLAQRPTPKHCPPCRF